jgi:hypothetical protein
VYAQALDFTGLYTFPNPLTKVPVGAALQADNLTANKDGTAECRRGLAAVGISLNLSAGFWINQIFSYQNHLIINDNSGGLWYDLNQKQHWINFPGTYLSNSPSIKCRGVEANKNFYITTQKGIYKMQTWGSNPFLAGVPPGLDGTGVLAGSGTGFLLAAFQCAYQIVFGYTDRNGNLLLGNPSERILVVNSTAGNDNVTLTFTVPQGLTAGTYFYQIYRTPQTAYSVTPASNVPPGAEPQLAAQQFLTAPQVAGLSVTYTDITPDELLGAALYTNPSQQGALQTNDRPPLCSDMCVFDQMMFYANCSTLQSSTVSMISVGSPNGIQLNDTVMVNGIIFTAKALQNNAAQQFKFDTSGTVSQNIDNTARNLIQCINANAATTFVYGIYLSGYNDLPGIIEFQAVGLAQPSFDVTSSRGSAFTPDLTTATTSSNDTVPNGIYVSKVAQPEAVPAVNLVFVGGGDQPIYRVLPLRDRVIVLKSDGVYVITGTTPDTLSITLLDSTIILIAVESAVLLNNSVYCMTNQGVVSITESGATIQSRAIEQDLLQLTGPQYSFFPATCNGISYESERMYILSMPINPGDTTGNQVWCYNWVTNAWTHWPIDVSCGFVNPFDNRLYMGRPIINNSFIYRERKNYLYTDFMDDQFPITITGVDASGTNITISTTPLASWVGYGLDQTNAGIAIITAVDTVNNILTVDLFNSTTPNAVISWTNGDAFVDVPIPITYVSAPLTAGFPHYFKSWTRVDFWFNGGNFQLITAGFVSNIQGPSQYLQAIPTGGYGFGPFGGGPYGGAANYPQFIQTLVPIDCSQANWIQPTLSLSFPQARLSFLGMTATYDIVSDVSG